MKKALLIVVGLIVLAVPQSIMAEPANVIAGTAVGYDWHGTWEADGAMNTIVWGAVKGKAITETMSLYAGYQYGSLGEVAYHGGKLILVEKSHIPHLYMLYDVGWLNKSANGEVGLTVGGGFSYGVTKYMSIVMYGMAMDRGDDFGFAIYGGVGVDNLWSLVADIID